MHINTSLKPQKPISTIYSKSGPLIRPANAYDQQTTMYPKWNSTKVKDLHKYCCAVYILVSFHSHFLVAGAMLLLLFAVLTYIPNCPVTLPVDGSRQYAYVQITTSWIDSIKWKQHLAWDL